MDDFLPRVEREFPALGHGAYLDSACIGVASRRAARAVADLAHSVQFCAAGSGTDQHGRLNDARSAARPLAARLLDAGAKDIALVESTTHGLAIAAQALPLEPGDEVVTCDLEFLQMTSTWRQLESRGVKVRQIPHTGGVVDVDAVREHLTPGVRVVALSSVQWTNGFRLDVEAVSALCRERGLWLLIDAAQHLGVLPFSVRETPVDILVCGGHKWLGSPFGTGILYLSPRIRPLLRRPVTGFFAARPPGLSRSWGETFMRETPVSYEHLEFTEEARAWEVGGTGNYPGAIGLAASLSLLLELRPARVARHTAELTGLLLDGLDRLGVRVVSPRGDGQRSAIVTFTLGRDSSDTALMRHLLGRGVAVSVRYASGVGGVRVSCHCFTTPQDIERLLAAVRDWGGRGCGHLPAPTAPASRSRTQIVQQQALIDALDDDLIGLVAARDHVARGIRLSRAEGGIAHTDLARERTVMARYHDRLGPDGTRLALELLRRCRGQT
ncbi:aminotransferase class V-fold PLP-dependent enzyme [Streptomyces acidiscabies]|uniref:aminotransferase class V-fold PLP-dependent enzyme n=1 Tax=Streptomyces acidiscabies TaxID=42234 RepID=UPI0038F69D28